MILAPIDRSLRDSFVLPHCVRLGTALKVPVAVLHVLAPPRAVFPSANREAEAYADAVAQGLIEEGVDAQPVTRRGDPTTVIVTVAREVDAQFIIMATRGRRGLDKFALGSVTDAVVAYSQVPVIIVNEGELARHVDEKARAQSAYLSTVVWNKRVRGLLSPLEAEREIDLLALQGLDRECLLSTYRALEEQGGGPIDWLDIDFQIQTLDYYLPQRKPGEAESNAA